MKNEKGITLIALVITIIVLLILAGISIAMLTGDNGLLTKSKQSAAASAVAGAKDEISLEFQKEMADYLRDKYTAGATPVAPTAQILLNVLATGKTAPETAATSATVHGCKVIVSNGDIVVMYPSSATAANKSDYYATGDVDSTNLTLTWTDTANVPTND